MSSDVYKPVSLVQINKKILYLALPMAATQFVSVASGFLCMMMLARLGHEVLAASALIFSTQMSIMIITMSLLFSLSLLIGHAYGAKNYGAIGQWIQQGWTFAVVVSIPLMIGLWHIGPALILLGQNKNIAAIVQSFFYAHTLRVLPLMLGLCNQQLCYGVQKQHYDLIANILGIFVLLLTGYALILGKFGCPQLGVAGLGYAMAAQAWFYFLFTSICFCFDPSFKLYNLFSFRVHKGWQDLIKLLKVSWPISLQISGEMLSFFATSTIIGWLGVYDLAAYQVVLQYLLLIIIPIFALSQASGILVGQARGAGKLNELKPLGYLSLAIAVTVSVITGLGFILFPQHLTALYLNPHDPANAGIVRLLPSLFAVVALVLLCDAVRNTMTGALRGLFDTKFPMFIGLIMIWVVGLPLGYVLGFILHFGVVGIASGTAIGVFMGAVIVLYRWYVLSNKYSVKRIPKSAV